MTDHSCPDRPTEDELQIHRQISLAAYAAAGVGCALGIVGNALSVLVLRCVRPRAAPIYLYLTALAVVDLLTLVSALPYVAYRLVPPSASCSGFLVSTGPFLAFYMAHCLNPLANGFVYISVYITFWITVDRYVAVRHPAQYAARQDRSGQARDRIVFSAVITFVANMPSVFYYDMVADSGGYRVDFHPSVMRNHWWMCVVSLQQAMLLGPVVAILVMNVMVMTRVLRIQRGVRAEPPPVCVIVPVYDDTERRLVWLLVAISGACVACNVLSPAVVLMALARPRKDLLFVLQSVGNDLQFANSLLNVLFYYVFSLEMRRALYGLVERGVARLRRLRGQADSVQLRVKSLRARQLVSGSLFTARALTSEGVLH
ncbi:probable G-protein coupled receptor AH9.1 [Pollicipes pollicipes]|uniref:probable G-protein coupled receptor AH9.1 n=1 Tax=Pollicipes pollicipes TaxID=41117 RepID=UPI0018857C95|nr:probable G-protein coupled receptor AH9.1 [Pollicipes pollicipes]